ncbi:acetyl-CoA carboxylase biotin carboxyl carrier protein [Tuberibacillus sp. Marseille-P3662]|uniref:acetyl-CoA carboxylase biotin carboxyl carrier protein n=1 Tax=Tuberibacillus sp. Marseille-P3662 TaxID=1965358 RepID=UPI000A1CA692|nr:acetyl-CoA carboxylase biotin carboxyl carrier protein [Tuberibacillus sp. Marseille-P3662]
MLKIQEIRELINLIDDSSINEFEYEHDGSTIKMKKTLEGNVVQVPSQQMPVQQPIQQQAQTADLGASVQSQPQTQNETIDQQSDDTTHLHKIESPMVGTFYAASSPEADPFVKEGDKVSEDKVVCIIEAMKLFNEIEAEVKGEIVEMLVDDGQLVEYGQPLFLVKPE